VGKVESIISFLKNIYLKLKCRLVASHPGIDHEEKISIVRQLIRGCDSSSKTWCVPNQVGYYRALRGISEVMNIETIAADLDKVSLYSAYYRIHLKVF